MLGVCVAIFSCPSEDGQIKFNCDIKDFNFFFSHFLVVLEIYSLAISLCPVYVCADILIALVILSHIVPLHVYKCSQRFKKSWSVEDALKVRRIGQEQGWSAWIWQRIILSGRKDRRKQCTGKSDVTPTLPAVRKSSPSILDLYCLSFVTPRRTLCNKHRSGSHK